MKGDTTYSNDRNHDKLIDWLNVVKRTATCWIALPGMQTSITLRFSSKRETVFQHRGKHRECPRAVLGRIVKGAPNNNIFGDFHTNDLIIGSRQANDWSTVTTVASLGHVFTLPERGSVPFASRHLFRTKRQTRDLLYRNSCTSTTEQMPCRCCSLFDAIHPSQK